MCSFAERADAKPGMARRRVSQSRRTAVGLLAFALCLTAGIAANAEPQDPRVEQTPLCRALLAAWRQLPSTDDFATWPRRAITLAKLHPPDWVQVDALTNLDIMKQWELERYFSPSSPRSNASPEERERYWQEQRAKFEAEIKAGTRRLYRATNVPIASNTPFTPLTTATIYRIAYPHQAFGTIANPHPEPTRTVEGSGYYVTSVTTWSGSGRGYVWGAGQDSVLIVTDKLYALEAFGTVNELIASDRVYSIGGQSIVPKTICDLQTLLQHRNLRHGQ
jgi:hypothetical protein